MTTNQELFDGFIDDIRKVLKSHNPTKGDSWKRKSERELIDEMMQEIHEFEIKNDPGYELLDIAASCYLVWAKRRLEGKTHHVR